MESAARKMVVVWLFLQTIVGGLVFAKAKEDVALDVAFASQTAMRTVLLLKNAKRTGLVRRAFGAVSERPGGPERRKRKGDSPREVAFFFAQGAKAPWSGNQLTVMPLTQKSVKLCTASVELICTPMAVTAVPAVNTGDLRPPSQHCTEKSLQLKVAPGATLDAQ